MRTTYLIIEIVCACDETKLQSEVNERHSLSASHQNHMTRHLWELLHFNTTKEVLETARHSRNHSIELLH